jgi:uncharacterized OsmC-like protein
MEETQVRDAVLKASAVFAAKPEAARSQGVPATASLRGGLACEVTGPNGERVQTDMARALGGNASGANPGWLLRAALASCSATCIAMLAAKQSIALTALEVTVTSGSDIRGLLIEDASVSAGLQNLRVEVRISAPGHDANEVEALARWACANSPVGLTDVTTAQVDVQVAGAVAA